MSLPIRQVTAFVKSSSPAPDLDQPLARDLVQLANGDRVEGVVTGISPDKITLTVNGDATPIQLDAIAAIRFATAGQSHPPADRGFRIRLTDGSSFIASEVKLDGQELILTLADQSNRRLKLDAVSAIEQVNGPLLWLSSLKPVEDKQIPQFDLTWPTRMDRGVTGARIRFGRIYDHGIGVHAKSILTFSLEGPYQSYKAFRTQYAIDDDGDLADVTVRIRLDDRTVHTQEHVKAGKLSPVILLPLDGAKKLTLEVDYGENGDTQDRFNWIEPALLRDRPETPTTQP